MADNEIYKPKPGDKVVKLADVVDFKVSYPKEFKGKKHLKDGETYKLHADQAKYFEEKGIGKISK